MKKKILTLLGIIAIFVAVIISVFTQEVNARETEGLCDYDDSNICCVEGGSSCGGVCDKTTDPSGER